MLFPCLHLLDFENLKSGLAAKGSATGVGRFRNCGNLGSGLAESIICQQQAARDA